MLLHGILLEAARTKTAQSTITIVYKHLQSAYIFTLTLFRPEEYALCGC